THPLIDEINQSEKYSAIEQLTLIEKDYHFLVYWKIFERENQRDLKFKLEIVSADFLELNSDIFKSLGFAHVLSNLPYSSGTAITQKLLEEYGYVNELVLMFQAEVAQRFRAEAGDSARGSLSLWTQNLWE